MTLITDNETLAAFCDRMLAERFVTIDTEFMRDRTFYPKLCLVQVAGETEAVAIDPLAPALDLAPLLGLMADETVLNRVIVVDGAVAGTIGSWGDSHEREVTYWIGRSYWGKGIATDALDAFLRVDRTRPLHARVASDNVASRRVLEKCGFRVIATERGFAESRSAEIEELVLRLDETASTSTVDRG